MCNGDDDPSLYYLMYTQGDPRKLKVLRLYASESKEVADYDIASRKSWKVPSEATAYGVQLAKENGFEFQHDRNIDPSSYREALLLD